MTKVSPAEMPESRYVMATGLYWGVRASFVNYITTSGDGFIHAEDGVETDGQSLFRFPVAAVSQEGERWRLSFSGVLRFLAHFGALDVGLGRPVIELGDGGRMIVEVHGRSVEIAQVESAQPVSMDDQLVWPPLRAKLTEEGSAVFGGVYSAGEELDVLRIAVAMPEQTVE